MIAAPKSGSGKTMIVCALLQALKNRAQQTVSFKCGPDYIDPMFHEKIIGVPSRNLDTFFTDEEKTRKLFLNHMSEKTFAVLEGVMGLYDGAGGVMEQGSSYDLAKATGTPVILVADVRGMGRSILPFLAGFLAYDKEQLIKAVILNRISKGFYETVKPLIEQELKLSVAGFLPNLGNLHIESRHLGLLLPDEMNDIKERLEELSEEFVKTVSMETVMEIADDAGELKTDKEEKTRQMSKCSEKRKSLKNRPVIAVAKDEAFCFYYADNLQILEEYGARVQYFSPLHDKKLPDNCSGLFIGGGYPELYARQLGENKIMCEAVKQAVESGMPTVAECGGFMYLHSAVVDREGNQYAMAGVLPGECHDTGKLVRFGYVEIQSKKGCFLPRGENIKGHEFHYYDSTDNGQDAVAEKPASRKCYSCIMEGENHWFGFPHLYYPSNAEFARRFVEKAEKYSSLS